MNKLIRITTVPISLKTLLKGQHHFMSSYFEVIGISSEGKELYDVHDEERIRIIPLEMTRTISPLKDIKALFSLYKILKKEKPLIVHSHTPKAGIIGMLASKLAGVPHRLHTVAGLPLLEAKGNKRKLLDFVEKITYACATKVYPNSNGLKEIIIKEKFCHPNKLKVIGNGSSNGINVDFFSPSQIPDAQKEALRNQLEIDKADFVFVFVGRIVGDKGINELVRAFQILSSKQNNLKLLLVGPLEEDLDPLSETTEKLISENKAIITVGYQNDVRPYLAVSHCLAFPSYREGFPNVVMQGGAMELPSIVSNINGCNEIIVSGENGLIVQPKSEKELFSAMETILENQNLYQHLKSNSRESIVSRFDQKVIWQQLLEEYQKLEKNVS